jgi:hypothetical protein
MGRIQRVHLLLLSVISLALSGGVTGTRTVEHTQTTGLPTTSAEIVLRECGGDGCFTRLPTISSPFVLDNINFWNKLQQSAHQRQVDSSSSSDTTLNLRAGAKDDSKNNEKYIQNSRISSHFA